MSGGVANGAQEGLANCTQAKGRRALKHLHATCIAADHAQSCCLLAAECRRVQVEGTSPSLLNSGSSHATRDHMCTNEDNGSTAVFTGRLYDQSVRLRSRSAVPIVFR